MNLSHGVFCKYDDELIVSSHSSDVDNREAFKCINSEIYSSLYFELFVGQDCVLASASYAQKSQQHNLSRDGDGPYDEEHSQVTIRGVFLLSLTVTPNIHETCFIPLRVEISLIIRSYP